MPVLKPKFSALIVFVCLMLASFAIARVATSQNSQKNNNKSVDNRRQDEEATPIQEGILTPKQRAHRKLFKHPGRRLLDIGAGQAGDIEVQVDSGSVIRMPESAPRTPVLQAATCHADAVVIGTLNNKSSQLTEDESFIFTDYEMTVEEVIKNNQSALIQANNTITITRDGGAVQINGRIFRARREDFRPPHVGSKYLFFLKFIPDTGSYLAYGNGTFLLNDNEITSLGDATAQELLNGGTTDTATFLNQLRGFAALDCRKN
jgi:hypothetical protein